MFGRRRFRAPTVNPVTRELTDDKPLSNTDAANSKAFIDKLASLASERTDMAQEFRRIEAEELANKAKSSIDDDWQKRFRAWLVGKPNPEDKGKALWATPSRELNLMRFPSIRKYITSHADARVEFEQMIERMRELGPYGLYGKVDILSTYIYFKYIVAGATINSADWLSDFNTIESTVEMENWKNNGTDGSLYNNSKYRREITDPQTGVVSYVWDDVPTLEPGSYRDWNMTTNGQQPIPKGSTSVPPQGPGKKPVTPPGSPKAVPRFQPQVVTTFLQQSSAATTENEWVDAWAKLPHEHKLSAIFAIDVDTLTEPQANAVLTVSQVFQDRGQFILSGKDLAALTNLEIEVQDRLDNLKKVGIGPGGRSSTTGPVRPGSTGSVKASPMNTSSPRPASSTATPMETGGGTGARPGGQTGSSGTGGGPPPPPPPPPGPKTPPTGPDGKPLTSMVALIAQLNGGAGGGLKKTGQRLSQLGLTGKEGKVKETEPKPKTAQEIAMEEQMKKMGITKTDTDGEGTAGQELSKEEIEARRLESERKRKAAEIEASKVVFKKVRAARDWLKANKIKFSAGSSDDEILRQYEREKAKKEGRSNVPDPGELRGKTGRNSTHDVQTPREEKEAARKIAHIDSVLDRKFKADPNPPPIPVNAHNAADAIEYFFLNDKDRKTVKVDPETVGTADLLNAAKQSILEGLVKEELRAKWMEDHPDKAVHGKALSGKEAGVFQRMRDAEKNIDVKAQMDAMDDAAKVAFIQAIPARDGQPSLWETVVNMDTYELAKLGMGYRAQRNLLNIIGYKGSKPVVAAAMHEEEMAMAKGGYPDQPTSVRAFVEDQFRALELFSGDNPNDPYGNDFDENDAGESWAQWENDRLDNIRDTIELLWGYDPAQVAKEIGMDDYDRLLDWIGWMMSYTHEDDYMWFSSMDPSKDVPVHQRSVLEMLALNYRKAVSKVKGT